MIPWAGKRKRYGASCILMRHGPNGKWIRTAMLIARPVVSALSLLSMPLRSSSTSHSSSRPIDDGIYRYYPNVPISRLVLRKEREELGHEFVILKMADMNTYYRIERRPSKGANINSKLRGCKAKDTITRLDDQDYERVCRHSDPKITQLFREPYPDLHTVFAFCNVIRRGPDINRYTLTKFNCYFFARTLTLLITRDSLVRQYRAYISPRNFDSLSGPEIDAIVDQVKMPTRVPRMSLIRFDSKVRMILLSISDDSNE